MELNKITDRIYWLPNEKENDRPVLAYIRGDKYSLAVDAGNSAEHVKKFYNEIKSLNMRLPDYTVITHWHWDHTFGMHAAEGKTIAGHLTNKKLKEVMQWKWSDSDMKKRLETGEDIEMCDQCIKVEYKNRNDIKVVPADIEFTGKLIIDLGGIHCVITEVDATHSDDSVFVYIPEEKALFVGDADCEDFYYNNGNYDGIKLKNMINMLEEIDFDIYVLGHDEPQKKDEVLNYLKERLEEISKE